MRQAVTFQAAWNPLLPEETGMLSGSKVVKHTNNVKNKRRIIPRFEMIMSRSPLDYELSVVKRVVSSLAAEMTAYTYSQKVLKT